MHLVVDLGAGTPLEIERERHAPQNHLWGVDDPGSVGAFLGHEAGGEKTPDPDQAPEDGHLHALPWELRRATTHAFRAQKH